jgi:hypothetical protein
VNDNTKLDTHLYSKISPTSYPCKMLAQMGFYNNINNSEMLSRLAKLVFATYLPPKIDVSLSVTRGRRH